MKKWALKRGAVAAHAVPLMNALYLNTCSAPGDPTMAWGTEVDCGALEKFVSQHGGDASGPSLSIPHVLIKAVGMAMVEHPHFNRRVLRRRIYAFDGVNVLLAMQHPRERRAEITLLRDVDQKNFADLSQEVWEHHRAALRGTFRYASDARLYKLIPPILIPWIIRLNFYILNNLNVPLTIPNERQRCSPVLVNYLSFPGAPPLQSYQASHLPSESYTLNVTLGGVEDRVAVDDDGQIVVKRMAKLFVRADHRLVDALQLGRFVKTLRDFLMAPEELCHSTESSPASESHQVVSASTVN